MFLISVKLTTKVKFRVSSFNPLDSLTPRSVSFSFIDNLTISRAESYNTERGSESQANSWKENEKFSSLYGVQIAGCLIWERQHNWVMLCVPGLWVAAEVGWKGRTRTERTEGVQGKRNRGRGAAKPPRKNSLDVEVKGER